MSKASAATKVTISDYRLMLREWFGARHYRITARGEIHVYGEMPNAEQVGWYLYGHVGDSDTINRLFGDTNL